MKKPGFVGLGMEGASRYSSTCRHSYHHISILSPAVMDFGEVVHDLVKTHRNKIRELHLYHGFIAFDGKAQSSSDNGTFTKGRIPHPFSTKFIFETIRDFECPAISSYVLTHQYQIGVLFHGLSHSIGNGINEPFFSDFI